MTIKELIEELKKFNEDDQVVVDLQTDIPFDDDLYDFVIDHIKLSGLEDSENEVRICPIVSKFKKY